MYRSPRLLFVKPKLKRINTYRIPKTLSEVPPPILFLWPYTLLFPSSNSSIRYKATFTSEKAPQTLLHSSDQHKNYKWQRRIPSFKRIYFYSKLSLNPEWMRHSQIKGTEFKSPADFEWIFIKLHTWHERTLKWLLNRWKQE